VTCLIFKAVEISRHHGRCNWTCWTM